MNIDTILEYVKRTNPSITKEILLQELDKSLYGAVALILCAENYKLNVEVRPIPSDRVGE